MLSSIPPPPLVTSALGLGLEAYVAVRASVAAGVADARATFEVTLVPPSPDWGFFVLAGLEPLVDALERLRVRVDDLDWLESVGAIDLSTRRRIAEARFGCNVDAAPEGTVVFPGEPVLAVEGPYWQAQLVGGMVESALGDSTLVATRFARLSIASGGADLVETGAATAHRLGGAPLLARAAYVGGAHSTTSALAARRYGLPVTAMLPATFALGPRDEGRALGAWLASAPDGSVVRVDTTHPEASLRRVATAAKDLARRSAGAWSSGRLVVELPDRDGASLAPQVAEAFGRVGLAPPPLVVSGDVDETLLMALRAEGSPVRAFAVRADAALAPSRIARYALVAMEEDNAWSPRMQRSSGAAPSHDPGRKLVARYVDPEGRPMADVAHASGERLVRAQGGRFVDRVTGDESRLRAASSAPLWTTVMRAGRRVGPPEAPSLIRQRVSRSIPNLSDAYRRVAAPSRYPIGLSLELASLKGELLAGAGE